MADKDNRVAIVTGGTTGLGAVTAQMLAARGYRTLITSLSDPDDMVTKIRNNNGIVEFIAADLSDSERSAQKIIKHAIDLWGRIDLLVNCAATISHKLVADVREEDWDAIFATNVKAPFFLSQQAFPHLSKTKGNIVNVSSINSWNPAKKNELYDSLKAALNNLTAGLALEFRDAGVRVNAVLPGGIKTPLVRQWLELFQGRTPTEADLINPAIATPEDIAPVILALASDDFRWVNGVELPVEGGFRLGAGN